MTRHGWAFPALAAAACVAGAVAAPSSWWGVGLVVAYAVTMLMANRVVPESYDGWRWGALLTAACVTLLAGIYAFLVEPFGPDPTVALVFAILLATLVAAVVMTS